MGPAHHRAAARDPGAVRARRPVPQAHARGGEGDARAPQGDADDVDARDFEKVSSGVPPVVPEPVEGPARGVARRAHRVRAHRRGVEHGGARRRPGGQARREHPAGPGKRRLRARRLLVPLRQGAGARDAGDGAVSADAEHHRRAGRGGVRGRLHARERDHSVGAPQPPRGAHVRAGDVRARPAGGVERVAKGGREGNARDRLGGGPGKGGSGQNHLPPRGRGGRRGVGAVAAAVPAGAGAPFDRGSHQPQGTGEHVHLVDVVDVSGL
mmetsp:Transcript_9405/g.39500  ORF Transcript_9405/g.39500 Transcript_9405/m.39500 type:complete len:268 (+) Transcript_9405:987-1790(+)